MAVKLNAHCAGCHEIMPRKLSLLGCSPEHVNPAFLPDFAAVPIKHGTIDSSDLLYSATATIFEVNDRGRESCETFGDPDERNTT